MLVTPVLDGVGVSAEGVDGAAAGAEAGAEAAAEVGGSEFVALARASDIACES